MKPETEVKTSLNVLYDAVFSGGTDQLVVKKASEDSYVIVLRATAAVKWISAAVKWISGKLVDQWIDGGVKDREDAKQDIIKIFKGLR
jgi:hypothetical protein